MRPLVWFRTDLRLADNPALSRATRDADRGVVAVFTLCADQWRAHDWGDPKADYVLRTLARLSVDLQKLNIPLRIIHAPRFADTPAALCDLAESLGCDALYYNRELEINEQRRDKAVRELARTRGLAVHEFDDATILVPGAVMTDDGGWYGVYTPFRRKFGKVLDEEGLELAPAPKRQPEAPCEPDPVPKTAPGFGEVDLAKLWPAGERAAAKRLTEFLAESAAGYADDRDFPGTAGTSQLSPPLAAGSISLRQCLRSAMDAAGIDTLADAPKKSGLSKWIDELIWREFYRHLIVANPRLCMGRNYNPKYDAIPWREDPDALAAWREGRTGVPIIDAAMRQLAATGWMHNRCRMIVAMFLTKNLLIDWRHGERHFMRQLVDADLANNNGGWQWAASTGTDAAPYFRVFNPVSQSAKFDPEGAYLREWLPELADLDDKSIHDPPPMARAAADYPEPIVDLKASRERAIRVFQECVKG